MTTTTAKSQRAPVAAPPSLPRVAPVALLALLMAPACRAEWKITPGVELKEIYTDNVKQEASQFARSQFITDLAPSLSIDNVGPRLKLHATLTSHLYGYSDDRIEGTNRNSNQVQANAKAKLVENLLFFDGSASVGQQSISAFGPQVNDNGYSDTNRTEVRSYRISPYISHHFGAATTAELRYVRDSVDSGQTGFGNSKADTFSGSLASGPAYRILGWSLQASRQVLDDSIAQKSTTTNASADLRWRVIESLTLNVNGGYDKYDYQSLGGETSGKSYSGGFTWTPSSRTSLQASAGKRYYGSSYSLLALHRSRRTVWNLNYSDAVTTTRAQFLLPAAVDTAALLDRLFSASVPDPVARQQVVDAYIRATGLPAALSDNINYFSNRYMLQKQLQASAAFNTAKTTTVLTATASRRNALSTGQSDSALLGSTLSSINDNTRQVGAGLTLVYRISRRSAVNLALNGSRTESTTTGIKDNTKSASLGLTKQLGRKLKGAIELRRNQGNTAVQGGRIYRENAVSATLSLQL